MRRVVPTALAAAIAAGAVPAAAADEVLFFLSLGQHPQPDRDRRPGRGALGFPRRCARVPLDADRLRPDPRRAVAVGTTGPGHPARVGDGAANAATMVRAYGRETAGGGPRCRLGRSGMTCTNAAGLGFPILRAASAF